MCLSVAISILVNEQLARHYFEYASRLFGFYVDNCYRFYGEEFLVYNVHSLLHLKAGVDAFDSFDNCAAWPFENYMQQLKKSPRSKQSCSRVSKKGT